VPEGGFGENSDIRFNENFVSQSGGQHEFDHGLPVHDFMVAGTPAAKKPTLSHIPSKMARPKE